MRIKIPQLVEALTGHTTAGHARLARTMLHRLELTKELDAAIVEVCWPWVAPAGTAADQ